MKQINKSMDFSVSMSVYKNDHPAFFEHAVNSIIDQTVPPSEVVIVVDGPVSESIKSIINNFEKKFDFFKIIWLNKNVGHGNARRIGLENCKNDLVALMDSDDISVRDRFRKQLKCFQENESLSIVGGYIHEFIDDVSNVVGIRSVELTDEQIKKDIKLRCPMNQMTVMFKKKDVENAGGYLDWHHNEDYYLWLRMYLADCTFKNLPDNLVNVRVGKDLYKRRGGVKYFKSEKKLQKYMLDNHIIGVLQYLFNISIRFIIQVLLPYNLRGMVFQRLFRKSI